MGASMKQPIIYCLRLLFFLHCCTFRSTLFPFQNKYSGEGYFGQKSATAPQWASTDGVPVFRADFACKSSQTIYIWWEMTLKNISMSSF